MSNRRKIKNWSNPNPGFPIRLGIDARNEAEAIQLTLGFFCRDQERRPDSRHKFYRSDDPPGQQVLYVSEDGGPLREVPDGPDLKRLVEEERRARGIPALMVTRTRYSTLHVRPIPPDAGFEMTLADALRDPEYATEVLVFLCPDCLARLKRDGYIEPDGYSWRVLRTDGLERLGLFEVTRKSN